MVREIGGGIGIERKNQNFNNLVSFLCGNDLLAIKKMLKFTCKQILDSPFRISSLVLNSILEANQGVQHCIFDKNAPFTLDQVKASVEILSVLPEGETFHATLPEEAFPFYGEKSPKGAIVNLGTILNIGGIISYVNDKKNNRIGWVLNPSYLHLSLANRLNSPEAYQKWQLQVDRYLDVVKADFKRASLNRRRIHCEDLSSGTLLNMVDALTIVNGGRLDPEENQIAIRKALERKMEFSTQMILYIESNRGALRSFEDKVWKLISKAV